MGAPAVRTMVAAALLALSIGTGGAAAAVSPARASTAADDALETQVLVQLNSIRRAHDLVPLRLSRPLTAAAEVHSRSMGTYGYFQHESRDGSEFWRRVKRFYGPRSGSWSVGENLLWSTAGLDAKNAVDLWMGSAGHRKNILTPRWREIGLSALSVAAAPGVFGGRDVVIFTTDFGTRS
jgi:uncharacterized protein YkwD